jgi:hypothetical protein
MNGACPAPFDNEPEQQGKLMRPVLEQLILQRGFEMAEAGHGRTARGTDL